MRKTLLLFVISLSVALSASGYIREVAPDLAITQISPNGRYVVSEVQGYVEIFDLETGQKYAYYGGDDLSIEYTFGMGNSMSDTGIGVGSTSFNGNACVWEKGEWKELPVPNPTFVNLSQGITPDATRICGQIGMAVMAAETEELMCVPCVWDRLENGAWSDPVVLPHPELDITGRVPQYVTALAISADGRTIAGQIRDYSGFMTQPILYRQDEKGEWSYEQLFPELANPDGIVIPPYPGEAPQNAPQMADFMTPQELAAYNQAVADWEAEGGTDFSSYPEMSSYMTPAEINAFNAAVDKYNKELAQYYVDAAPYLEALEHLFATSTSYLFNNVYLSQDGRMYASTILEEVEDEVSWSGWKTINTPVLMDVEKEEYTVLLHDTGLTTTCVTNDYSVLANTDGLSTPKQAFISAGGTDTWVRFDEWLCEKNENLGKWYLEKASHSVEVIDEGGVLEVLDDYVCSGNAICNPDMTLFATFAEVTWESDTSYFTESLIFSMENEENGVRYTGIPEGEVVSESWFTIDGKRLDKAPESGLFIHHKIFSNGAVTSEKKF